MKKEKTPKPKYNMWQNTCFMLKLAWNLKEKKVPVLCFMSAALAVSGSLLRLYVSPAILSVVERKSGATELIITILSFTGAMMLVAAAEAYVGSNTLFGRITVRSAIVNMLNKKASTTSYPNVYDEKFIKLLSKSGDATNSNRKATEAIWETLTSILKNVACFALYAAIISVIQPILLLIIVATTTIGYFIGKYAGGYGYRHREEEADLVRKINYISQQSGDWSSAKDIRIFNVRPWFDELLNKSMDAYTAFHRKAQGVYLWSGIADTVLAFSRNGFAYMYLIGLVLSGDIDAPEFLLLFSAVGGFTEWVSGILGNFNTLYSQSLDISTVRECLEFPEPFCLEPVVSDAENNIQDGSAPFELKLENVSFRYPGADNDTLSDINLTLHPGEKLAIVGRNGAGKTTLVKLLCGLLDPTKGSVLIDGRDVRRLNRVEYYRLFSAVFQNFSLLAGTIACNVAQTDDNIDVGRVNICLEKAELLQKVTSLPDGIETHMCRDVYEDAVMFSGGETQRLMLARALYKDAPFIILDEPTAALDPIAESKLYLKYHELTRQKSSVYISHRLISTHFCDRIIFIDNSIIAEEGTHEELLRHGGKYAELFEIQSKYYKEGTRANEENKE